MYSHSTIINPLPKFSNRAIMSYKVSLVTIDVFGLVSPASHMFLCEDINFLFSS